jgi:two-component system, cell cycle response regulator DivK
MLMKKILMIEDILDNAELARKMLNAGGYEVLHAEDAESGLRMAQELKPDLILLDLGLPDYDGQTLAGWLRADRQTAHIPIVACTAWPAESARAMSESYGCNGFIGKPLPPTRQFLAQIAAFFK